MGAKKRTIKYKKREVPSGNYHTRRRAAERVGRSVDTLKRWQRDGTFVPTRSMKVGELTVWLYSDADIETMKVIASTMHPGRRAKGETGEQQ